MRRLSTGLAAVGAVWFAAVVSRSVVTRLVAGRRSGEPPRLASLPGAIDAGGGLWRGPAPKPEAYGDLAAAGIALIVDLRSEANLDSVASLAASAGLELLWLPTDNGRVPEPRQLDELEAALSGGDRRAYVHCEAGEGRTGALIGAHRVRRGDPVAATIADALAIGSLTFAQLTFIATGGRRSFLCTMVDWSIDRPTELAFDLVTRSVSDAGVRSAIAEGPGTQEASDSTTLSMLL